MTWTEFAPRGLAPRSDYGLPAVIVGGDTALDTKDDDASYVDLVTSGSLPASLMVDHWIPVSDPAPPAGAAFTRLEVDVRWRVGPQANAGQSAGWQIGVNGRGRWATTLPYGNAWTDLTGIVVESPEADFFAPEVLAAFPDGVPNQQPHQQWHLQSLVPGFGGTIHARITYLRMRAEWGGGPIPLAWRQRSDGLGLDTAPSWRSSRASAHGAQWRGTI